MYAWACVYPTATKPHCMTVHSLQKAFTQKLFEVQSGDACTDRLFRCSFQCATTTYTALSSVTGPWCDSVKFRCCEPSYALVDNVGCDSGPGVGSGIEKWVTLSTTPFFARFVRTFTIQCVHPHVPSRIACDICLSSPHFLQETTQFSALHRECVCESETHHHHWQRWQPSVMCLQPTGSALIDWSPVYISQLSDP